jgi:hypothetical protein
MTTKTTQTNTPKAPSMRLTVELRAQIVKDIMADMPALSPSLLKDYRDTMDKRAREIAVDDLPEKVKAIYNDPTLRPYINTEYVSVCCVGYNLPTLARGYDSTRALMKAIETDPAFDAAHKAYDKLRDDTQRIRSQLALNVAIPRTVKAFVEMFPDLAKYAPEEPTPATANLPATTALMDSLKAAGLKVGGEG